MRPLPLTTFGSRLAASGTAVALAIAVLLTGGPALAEPSAAEVREQQERAAELAADAKEKVATSAEARDRLQELAVEAGRSLEEHVIARDEARKAREQEAAEQARYDAAKQVVREERIALGRYASSTYRNGSGTGEMAMIAAVLSAKSITEIGRSAADLKWAGTQQSRAVDRFEEATLAASRAASAAAAAAARARAAEQRAREAEERAAALLAEQDALVVVLDKQAAAALDAAALAKTKAKQMEKAKRVAALYRAEAERQRRAALGRGEVVQVLVDGSCPGGDLSNSPNGQIDRSLLCPLWGAEWHVLRADAAATFNRMSQAYAEEFGRPICVTDSYRSLEMQIDVHKRKPDMTAIPGTSNHGWGTAVDLCDGVENFGTPAFQWLQANAPRFHWYHPRWAAEGGSRPEPWHWEFAG